MTRISVLLVLLCQIITLPILASPSDTENQLEGMISSLISQYAAGESGDSNAPNILSMMGSLLQGGAAKNLAGLFGDTNNGGAEDVLSGLGSLLGGQNGFDPSMLANVVSLFSNMQPPKREKRETPKNEKKDISDFDGFVNLAEKYLEEKKTDSSYLPLIMNVINTFTGASMKKEAEKHKDHASFLPPFLEKAHLYWDLFINSELGKTVWEKSGFKRALKSFTGPDGKLSFELMFKNFENHSFRRHWIKAAAKYLTDFVIYVAKPEVYQRYLATAPYFINTFLDSQGIPADLQINLKTPEKSITKLLNHVVQKYLNLDTDVSDYVKPAVDYVKQTLKMAQTATKTLGSREDYNALADRVTDTLNLEVIEPVLRVYRAYKHSVKAPHCQEHLMCLVNKHHDQDKQGLPGFKAGLTKFSSLAASAALSFQNGKGFLDLYNAIQSDVNCEAAYPADCAAFHEHEMKVTTEVYHSEL